MSAPDNPQFDPQRSQPQSAGQTPAIPEVDGSPSTSLLTSEPVAVPAENPEWNVWDVLLIAVLAFVFMVVLQYAAVKTAQLFLFPHATFNQAAKRAIEKPIIFIIPQIVFYIPVLLVMFGVVKGKYQVPFWRTLCWNWPSSIWKFLAVGAAMLLVLAVFENLFPMPKDTLFERLFDTPLDSYLMALIAVTFAPLVEELFFRGFLYPVIARWLGVSTGIFLSALPFGLLHLSQYGYSWVAASTIFIVGVVCGIVRASTKSVGACFLVHAAYNGTQMAIVIVASRGFTHMPKSLIEWSWG